MVQTILGNLFVGGLIVFSILALLLPIFAEARRRLHMPRMDHLKKVVPMLTGMALGMIIFWALAN